MRRQRGARLAVALTLDVALAFLLVPLVVLLSLLGVAGMITDGTGCAAPCAKPPVLATLATLTAIPLTGLWLTLYIGLALWRRRSLCMVLLGVGPLRERRPPSGAGTPPA